MALAASLQPFFRRVCQASKNPAKHIFDPGSNRRPSDKRQTIKTERKLEGVLGEQLVSDALARLPAAYYHVDNLVLPVKGRIGHTTQIDHVIVSRFGIFVVETKKFRGAVMGGESDPLWFQILGGRRFPFRNPLEQNRYHVAVIAGHLGLPPTVFRPVVAFVGLTELRSPGLPHNVLTTIAPGVPGLRRYIEQFTRPILSAEEAAVSTATLIGLKGNGLTLEHHLQSIRSHSQAVSQENRCGYAEKFNT